MSVAHLSLAPASAGMMGHVLYPGLLKCSCRECEVVRRKNLFAILVAFFAGCLGLYPGTELHSWEQKPLPRVQNHINIQSNLYQCVNNRMQFHSGF